MSYRKTTLIAALAVLAIPATANAASPESGNVGPEAKKTTWTGSITDPFGAYDLAMFLNGSTEVQGNETCMQPVCDVYTLTVKPGGKEIRITASGDSDNTSLDISAPDGTRTYLNTEEYLSERELIAEALPGDWTIRVHGTPGLESFDYTGTAEINLPDDPSFYPEEEEEEVEE